jgi:hypothetical protein
VKIKLIAFLLILILISINGIYADQDDQPRVTLHGSTIIYEGLLNEEGFNKIKSTFLKANRDVKWLYINSPGGEINISMDIGFWVFQNHLNIRVQERCLSSCANYIFTAGKNKFLEKNAIVAWHGSVVQESLANLTEDEINKALISIDDPIEKEKARKQIIGQYNDYLDRMKNKQESFFKTIGTDQSVTVIGQNPKYNVKDFWILSIEDMAKFGILNVKGQNYYPEKIALKYSQVTYIKLKE